ncbi:metallophosphoesterase [Aquisalimonas sp.]|uniref:metallophosphoesterase n=1 Tax=Aquisalimonas sp. TaxID=1872621 RepID=UPI0025BEC7AA|nr:metallophosphoesterase [Aquisalimonas sp.]
MPVPSTPDPQRTCGSGVRLRYLDANLEGRDFVVGDLHGCRAPFDRALQALDFDPASDRVLSVGDLIDRGPDSPGCLALLQAPWFHAVMGNHEAMLAARLTADDRDPDAAQLHIFNGGDWFQGQKQLAGNETLQGLVHSATRLPHLLIVGSGEGRFHLVHAELPARDDAPASRDHDIDAGLPGVDPSTLLWARLIMAHPGHRTLPEIQPGLSTTYCGHTPDRHVRRRLSHVCLDTGAVFAQRLGAEGEFGLSIAEIAEGRERTIHRFVC